MDCVGEVCPKPRKRLTRRAGNRGSEVQGERSATILYKYAALPSQLGAKLGETGQALQYQISGRMHVVMDDGSEAEFGPGDVGLIPPGHDAWVVGNEPVVAVDIQGMVNYAKK